MPSAHCTSTCAPTANGAGNDAAYGGDWFVCGWSVGVCQSERGNVSMKLTVTMVDYNPPDLNDQVPFSFALVRQIPGPDRPDWS